MSAGTIIPVLSFEHLSDLAVNPDAASRRRTGEYLDKTRRLGQVLWIEGLNTIAADELQAAYERTHLHRRSVQTMSPFSSMFVDSLDYKNHGDPRQREVARRHERALGIVGMIEAIADSPGRQEYADFRSELPSSMTRIRDSRGPTKWFSVTERRLFVLDIVEKAHLVFASTADRDRFVDDALARQQSYPALDLRLSYRQGAILTNGPAEPSDAEDYDHLTGIAYCDVAFADKRTIDVIRRGGYARLPLSNGRFCTWVATCARASAAPAALAASVRAPRRVPRDAPRGISAARDPHGSQPTSRQANARPPRPTETALRQGPAALK